ncbi:hypothetical protein GWI33_010002, partial [Rhynchophorus ferrugineus]
MIGAYTTYVVQNLFKTYLGDMVDWYLIAAIPAAFLVSAIIGMIIERLVIRPLYGRQLETLLATFGVSLILMQLVRMIFGAQNVEVSNISWLSGSIEITPSLMLPYNRIAIIAFTVVVLLLLVFLLNKTRFGLFVRAVTQNRQMARAVGIRSARIDMLAFGLGSGLAGLAGCALAQVVVVVGGVGQVWGAVLAALGLGVSGTVLEIGMGAVLAKIILLVLVILFIQKRPQVLLILPWFHLLPPDSPMYLSAYWVTLIGKIMCLAMVALALDLVWGYAGILSLGHGLYFALGGYAFGMYLMRQSAGDGLPDFMRFLSWTEMPWYWAGIVAFIFGFFAFRSKIKGVYFSIITQAMVFAAALLFFRNETGFGGNNGFTGFKTILGYDITAASTRATLCFLTALILLLAFVGLRYLMKQPYGRVLGAIRDSENRLQYL